MPSLHDIHKEFDKEFKSWECSGCKRSFDGDPSHRQNPIAYCQEQVKSFYTEKIKELLLEFAEAINGSRETLGETPEEKAWCEGYHDCQVFTALKSQEVLKKLLT